jgi:hypothetical protein
MSRTKLIAAALMVAGGLAAGAWARLTPPAGAQDPTPPEKRHGEPRAEGGRLPLSRELEILGRPGVTFTAPSRWEFKHYVPAGSLSPTVIEQVAARHAADGWVYSGTATFPDPSPADRSRIEFADAGRRARGGPVDVLVFRRPAAAEPNIELNRATGEALLLQFQGYQNTPPGMSQPGGNRPAQRQGGTAVLPPASAAEQIAALQKQIDALRAAAGQRPAPPAITVEFGPGVDTGRVVTVLETLAEVRYGAAWRQKVGFSRDDSIPGGLKLMGDAAAVEWAAGLARTLKASVVGPPRPAGGITGLRD